MVFGSLRHGFNLFGRKPLEEVVVLSDDSTGDEVVQCVPFTNSEVVKSCDSEHHVFIELRVVFCQFEALCHDTQDVVGLVGAVELFVAGKYELHDIFPEGRVYFMVHHLLVGIARSTIGHVYDAAIGVAVLPDDMLHDMVGAVCVDAYRRGLRFAPFKDLFSHTVCLGSAGEAVDGAVGSGVVEP